MQLERERLDLEVVGGADEAVKIGAEVMRGKLGKEAGAEPAEGAGVIGVDMEQFVRLAIDGLDNLADNAQQATAALRSR